MTTRVSDERIRGLRRTPTDGGRVGAAGPKMDGKGSITPTSLGGSTEKSRRTIHDLFTSVRKLIGVRVGEWATMTDAQTQMIARPVTIPSSKPPTESRTRNGVSRKPPRR